MPLSLKDRISALELKVFGSPETDEEKAQREADEKAQRIADDKAQLAKDS